MTEGHRLVHKLRYYDLAALSISGTTGSGMLVASGISLSFGGCGSLLFGFLLVCIVAYTVLCSLCEMATYIPLPDGCAGMATRYVDPAFGFASGYFYFFKYLVLAPTQISAASLAIQYWIDRETINPALWVTIFIILDMICNFVGIQFYATIVKFFAGFKVIVLIGLVIFCFALTMGAGPTNERVGFRYWKDPGAFKEYFGTSGSPGRFAAFLASLVTIIYPFAGIEIYGAALAEAHSPMRKNIHKANNLIMWTIFPIYICLIFFMGMIVSSDDPLLLEAVSLYSSSATNSPFVIAAINAGIKVLPHILNSCLLIFIFTASNTELYVSIRTLYGLSINGMAPKIFSKTNKRGVPYAAFAFCSLFSVLGYMNSGDSSKIVYQHFLNVDCTFILFTWLSILISHFRFTNAIKVQGIQRKKELYYTARFTPYTTYFSIGFSILLMLIKNFTVFLDLSEGSSFDYKSFISGYICIPVFFIFYFFYKFYHKTHLIPLEEVDLFSYKDVIDAEEEAYYRDLKTNA
ncbi:dicarboxylic amino acid permease [Ascoidea rubescens DSM 1968]|uniref:Dicarboxylic amino acid permease n=1 Tax=Ascoidea rubescens DSM 1968 TaxID=1344418 RepID=A0A1D2VGN9_9ASCO|nr:dicarboxylic amino acid permease [Ascoidea rubescens DSM 1968]ODV60752.1 dicarboxylic amino acid permease [Ascoidea rubescens DSM 1968]